LGYNIKNLIPPLSKREAGPACFTDSPYLPEQKAIAHRKYVDNQTPKSPPPSDEEISRQLERVLSSPDFKASPRQIAFLKFVVNKTLAGNAGEINNYTVANQVFGRGPDFDQSVDPVVSIQASLLRRVLERYYLTGGKHDPIRIDMPPDTYAPVFEWRLHAQTGRQIWSDSRRSPLEPARLISFQEDIEG
jgi:hypothetical protein